MTSFSARGLALFRVVPFLSLVLLWAAHALTLVVALPSHPIPSFHPTFTPALPSPTFVDDDDVQWLALTANTTDGNSDFDVLGSTIQNAGGVVKSVPMGWVNPKLRGGRMLDFVLPRKGEPLNVIISGLSDPYVLTTKGLLKWAQSIGYSSECLGLHVGQLHIANLGDGVGNRTEQLLARRNFDWPSNGWPDWGTCWETIVGGNHFRAWKQDGALARTGAWFLAVSAEHSLVHHHTILPDGYNYGRDLLISRAVHGNLPTYAPPYNFQSVPGYVWKADLTWEHELLKEGHRGINHGIHIDGRVAVLTIRRLSGGEIGNGTGEGSICETGDDGADLEKGPCRSEGDELTGGEKRREEMRKAVAFWVRAARVCGQVLQMAFGWMRGVFSTIL